MNIHTDAPDFELPGVKIWSAATNAGAEVLGASAYELEAGARWADLHVHYANEELLVVLEGTPTVHTLEGSRGAHRLENLSAKPARFLMVSTMLMPEMVEYPETGRVFTMTEPPYTDSPYDEQRGRIIRSFDIASGNPVPPDG